MAHLDTILDILERHHAIADLRLVRDCFLGREDVLENPYDAQSEFGCEAFEDKVWIRFADGAARRVRDVMTEDNVVKGERDGWAVREM